MKFCKICTCSFKLGALLALELLLSPFKELLCNVIVVNSLLSVQELSVHWTFEMFFYDPP